MSYYQLVRSNSHKGVRKELATFESLPELRSAYPISINGTDSALEDVQNKDDWSVYVNLLDANGKKIEEIDDPRIFSEDI